MIHFADEAVIEVTSGKGGNGCASFRREKYIPLGGPSGGDGGNGGNIIFCVKKNMRTLVSLRGHPIIKAKNGTDGMSWNKHGKNGEDKIIPLPPGTTISDYETGEVIHEFTTQAENEQFVFLKGGKGGWGNVHFKSSTNQAPRRANKGTLGETRKLKVELSIMADVGLVGFPNAGKSSLLTAFTNARPKVAPYPFTTKIPNLGVLRVDDERDIIIADIPGIIEGASEGAGLGIKFLKHISRTSCLVFIIDASDPKYLTTYETLCAELLNFNEELSKKPRLVLCNKIDIDDAKEKAQEIADQIHKNEPNIPVIAVSILMNYGMTNVKKAIISLVDKMTQSSNSKINVSENNENISTQQNAFMALRESINNDAQVQYPGSEQ